MHRGYDNHKCHNKKPRLEIGLGCEWRHARKRWAGEFGDFEKDVSWDLTLGEASPAGGYGIAARLLGHLVEIWLWARPVQLGATGCAARLLGQLVEIWPLAKKDQST